MPHNPAHTSTNPGEAAYLDAVLHGRVALTPKEFAALFGKSETWAYRKLYAGKIRRLEGSASILIPRAELERFLNETINHE